MGGKFACGKKTVSQIQYLCNEGYHGGDCASFHGAALAGKADSVVRLPPALTIILLAAWGKALVLKRSNLVVDIRLPVKVGITNHVRLVCLSWGCLAQAWVSDVFRMTVLDNRAGVSLN